MYRNDKRLPRRRQKFASSVIPAIEVGDDSRRQCFSMSFRITFSLRPFEHASKKPYLGRREMRASRILRLIGMSTRLFRVRKTSADPDVQLWGLGWAGAQRQVSGFDAV
jgi:hypothetical protein